jgi:hypothetical protein
VGSLSCKDRITVSLEIGIDLMRTFSSTVSTVQSPKMAKTGGNTINKLFCGILA